MKFSSLPQKDFFLSTYFMVNFVLIMSYPVMRLFTSVGRRDLRVHDSFGFTYENSIIYTGLAFMGIFFIRSVSFRELLLNFITIAKLLVACLLVFAKFYYSIWYLGICVLVWMVVPYPRYKAPHKFVKVTSEEHFDELLSKTVKKRGDDDLQGYYYRDKQMYFVEFYADWLVNCTISKELWYRYSSLYTTPQLVFIQVNVEKLPELAKRYSVNISGFTKQLPTIIILDDGEESARFPPIQENNKVDRVVKLDYKILLKYFDLESRYLQTRLPRKIE